MNAKTKGSPFKWLGAFLMSVLMVLACLPTAALAVTTGHKITLTNPQAGHTYTLYQVLVGDYSDGDVLSNIKWGMDGLQTEDPSAEDSAAKLVGMSGEDLSNKAARLIHDMATGTPKSAATTTDALVWEGLSSGYYVIKDTAPQGSTDKVSRSVVKVLGSNVEVTQKAESVPVSEKTANKTTADLGDPITYTLSATLKDISAFSRYQLTFEDTMAAGLTYNGDAKLKINEQEFTATDADKGITFTVTKDTNTVLTVDIANVKDFGAKQDDVITVTYTASINENAFIATGVPNTFKLGYTRDPDVRDQDWTIPVKRIVYTGSIDLTKYANSVDAANVLAGAGFVLRNYKGDYYKGIADVPIDKDNPDVGTYKAAQWTPNEADALILYSGNDGKLVTKNDDETTTPAIFTGLAAGDYTLTETVTPAGYNTVAPISVKLELGDAVTYIDGTTTEAEGTTYTAALMKKSEDVINNSGTTLPSTGGMGTTLLYAVGGALVVVAAGILIYKKVRPQEA